MGHSDLAPPLPPHVEYISLLLTLSSTLRSQGLVQIYSPHPAGLQGHETQGGHADASTGPYSSYSTALQTYKVQAN